MSKSKEVVAWVWLSTICLLATILLVIGIVLLLSQITIEQWMAGLVILGIAGFISLTKWAMKTIGIID